MNDFQLLPVQAGRLYTVDFTDDLPSAVTVSSVVWSISPSLTLAGQVDDFVNAKSSIRISGASHGVTYTLQALATYSNGETFPKDVTLLGFNA